jgi:hypothetical protein
MTDTAFYAEMQATAQELLEDFGAPVALVKEGSAGGGYDADGNVQAPVASVSVTGVGAITRYKINEIDGTVIQSGDCGMLFRGGDPQIDMTVMLGVDKWRIVDFAPTWPAQIVTHYTLQLRK